MTIFIFQTFQVKEKANAVFQDIVKLFLNMHEP